MNKFVLIFFLITVTSITAVPWYNPLAGWYNPYSGRFENVPDDWVLSYNPFKAEFSYQPPNASLYLNIFKGVIEWDSGHNPS